MIYACGALLALLACGASASPVERTTPRPLVRDASTSTGATDPTIAEPPVDVLPPRLTCLTEAYPDAIERVESRDDGWVVVFGDGREAQWDDGRDKEPEARLADPDLEDTLAQAYPAGREPGPVAENEEPGRVRHAVLLDNAYGADERAVRQHLVEVPWPGSGPVRMSSRNGAADALRSVLASFADLPDEALLCVRPPIGSFSYREIRGTERLSPHAYGIAIDLNLGCGEYWRWQRPFEGRWQNRMPQAVIDAFEAHGFVWGGRWYHYDTFHFEYRPELFVPACRPDDAGANGPS